VSARQGTATTKAPSRITSGRPLAPSLADIPCRRTRPAAEALILGRSERVSAVELCRVAGATVTRAVAPVNLASQISRTVNLLRKDALLQVIKAFVAADPLASLTGPALRAAPLLRGAYGRAEQAR
jgi:hypothetical protein